MARRPPGATKLEVDLIDDDKSEWIDRNTRSIPASSERKFSRLSEETPDSVQPAGRSSEHLFQGTSRNSTISDALFMSPTSRMLYDRSSQHESNQAAGLLESQASQFLDFIIAKLCP
jgi:hypothetical protein